MMWLGGSVRRKGKTSLSYIKRFMKTRYHYIFKTRVSSLYPKVHVLAIFCFHLLLGNFYPHINRRILTSASKINFTRYFRKKTNNQNIGLTLYILRI